MCDRWCDCGSDRRANLRFLLCILDSALEAQIVRAVNDFRSQQPGFVVGAPFLAQSKSSCGWKTLDSQG